MFPKYTPSFSESGSKTHLFKLFASAINSKVKEMMRLSETVVVKFELNSDKGLYYSHRSPYLFSTKTV